MYGGGVGRNSRSRRVLLGGGGERRREGRRAACKVRVCWGARGNVGQGRLGGAAHSEERSCVDNDRTVGWRGCM